MLPASFKISLKMLAECTVPKITGEKKEKKEMASCVMERFTITESHKDVKKLFCLLISLQHLQSTLRNKIATLVRMGEKCISSRWIYCQVSIA